MKKAITILLALVMVLSLAACGGGGGNKEPLTMKRETMIVSPRGDGASFSSVIDYEASEVTEEDVTAKSSDEEIAVIDGTSIKVLGSKLGEADITFSAKSKTGILHISVLDYPEYLKTRSEEIEKKDEIDTFDQGILDEYAMYCGITRDLESFKNPSSVQVVDGNYYYSKSHDKFIVEIRATNSFGGYTSAYFYVTSLGASQIDWSPASVGLSSYRGEDYYKTIPFYLPKAVASYISSKY